ncbi:hypothetical protein RYX36_023069, partial [Vicia faba]
FPVVLPQRCRTLLTLLSVSGRKPSEEKVAPVGFFSRGFSSSLGRSRNILNKKIDNYFSYS